MVHLMRLLFVDVTNVAGKSATEFRKYKLVVEAHGGDL